MSAKKMWRIAAAVPLMLLLGVASLYGQNPVPQIAQPLVPMTAAPGGDNFVLTVNGTGFVSTSQVNWNGSGRATTFVNSRQLTAAIDVVDIAAAGTALVTVVNPTPGGGTSNVAYFHIIDPFSPVTFGERNYAAGDAPYSVIAQDFNADGKLDLAVANASSNTLSILLGNGDGTFQDKVDYAVGNVPYSVTAADFNGDGRLDLAAGNSSDGTVSILLGNGDGTFQAKVDYATGLGPTALTAGDFNADGKLDLAVANNSATTLSVLLGNGDGTFQAKVDYDMGTNPLSIFSGDFNGDGDLDLAATSYDGQIVSVLLGNGDGTFQTHTDYTTAVGPRAVTAADFNGDGRLDLAVANGTSYTVSVFLRSTDGTTFAPKVDYATAALPYSVTTGDLNGDGKVDLAVSNYSSFTASILLGNGDGTFQTRQDFSAGNYPTSVAAGDFNGDGMLDLAVADYSDDAVSILIQGPIADTSTSSLAFGDQIVDTSSTSQAVTLTNTGNKPLSISVDSMGFTGTNSADFSQTTDCPDEALAQTLAVDASCTINVTFTPSGLGTRTAALSIPDDAPDSPQTVSLTGRGVSSGVVGFSMTSLNFGNQVYNTTSAPQTVTLTNNGAGPLGIASITTSTGDFVATQCPASLDIGLSCDIGVTFTPSTVGVIGGTLTITDDAAGSPHTVSLSGTGIAAQVSLSITSVQFSERSVGTTSPAQSVTLTNVGQVTLNIASIAITGDFAQTNTCGSSVAVNASCTFQVTFTPTAVLSRSGQITITDDAPGSPHTISLSGSGYVARLSPTEINFDEQAVGTTTQARNLTLSNTGPTAIAISSIAVSGDFSQTHTCGTSLAAGSRCTIAVSFAPTAAGYASGSVTVSSDAPDGSLSVFVYGTGVVLGLSPRSLSFPGQPVGVTSAPQTVTLTNTGSATLNFASFNVQLSQLNTTPSPDFAENNNCGTSLAAGASCTIQVTFTPTSAVTAYGTLTISSDSLDGTRYVDLNGVGVVLTASPRPVLFAARAVDTTSAPQTVTLTNTGQTVITLSSVTGTGDFGITNNCGTSLAAGGSCTVDVTFTPTALDPRTGYLNVSSTAPEGTLKVLLIGASGIRGQAGFASNVLPANDDGSTELIPMGFTINYFGNQYSALYVNNNGDVTFDTQLGTFTPFDLTSTGQVIMAPFFGDVDTRGSGSGVVTYGRDTVNGRPAFGVNWFDVGYFGSHADKLNVFQLVIIDRSDVAPGDFEFEFNYAKVEWETGDESSGSGGLGGFSARAGYSNGSGDPDTFLEIPGSAVNGAFLDSNTDTGLIHNSFNSTQFGRYLFNGRGGGVEPPGLHLSPASLTLPGTPLDMICPTKTVTVSNTGGTPIAISNVTTNTTEFVVATNDCPASLIPGATCTISVEFHPAALGVRQGTLTVESDDPRGPQTVAVSGEGLPACNLIASRRSAAVVRGTVATNFDISDANPSCSPEPIELSCAENDPASCTFSPAVIPPSGRSSLRVGNLTALRSDTLNFVVNSRSEFRTAAIGLSVLVKDFAFTTAPDVATVEAGGTASYSLAVRPVNGFAGTVMLSCSGAPRGATCTVEPSQVTLDGASLAQVRVKVRTTARAMAPPVRAPQGPSPLAPWAAVLAVLLLAVAAASRRRRLALAVAMFSVLVWAACGGGGMVSTGGAGGTPPGTSSLTVTGTYTTTPAETAAGAPSQVTGSASLTLTVR